VSLRTATPGTQTAFLAGVNGATIPGPTKTIVLNASRQLGTPPAGTAHAPQAGSAAAADLLLARTVGRQSARAEPTRRSATGIGGVAAASGSPAAGVPLVHGHH
jgi:hypothetical protein